jgi:pentatricopeptide repeat protein
MLKEVRHMYDIGQTVLAQMDHNPKYQTLGWFQIEDGMVMACARCGEMDLALMHRKRILDQGGSPGSDAYGCLIQHMTDTTDDASNALALFHECQSNGVTPTVFLFNTIIAKLSRARKADQALELFQQMKAAQLRPSSVTYGTLIAACTRVGDASSAEMLFSEMAAQYDFRPKIPPYNTMMQFYAHTKPNRERVLFFYDELQRVGITPTEHTYKVHEQTYRSCVST